MRPHRARLRFFTMFCFVSNNYCNHPFYKLVGLDPGLDAKSLTAKFLALALTVVSLTPSLGNTPRKF